MNGRAADRGRFRVAAVVRVGRSHYFAGFQAARPLVTLGRERELTEPRGVGVYVEWAVSR